MKKIILLTTVIVLMFSMTCFVHADTSGGETDPEDIIIEEDTGDPADPQSTVCSVSFKRTSSTKARAQASALRSKASSITSVIYLQKKKAEVIHLWTATARQSRVHVSITSTHSRYSPPAPTGSRSS